MTPSPPNAPARPADEPSFVLFTSGTTSKPKGVIHSLSTLMKASTNYIAAAGLGADDRIFLISPLASVTGVVQALFIAPVLAAPVILEDKWEPAATCDLLLTSGATWYGGPDRLLDRLLDEAVAASRRGAAACGVPGRHRVGPAHRRAHRGRLRHHRHACLRFVGGAGEHVGPTDRTARRPACRRRGDAGRRRGEGRARRRNPPSAASEGRTRSSVTPMPTTIRRRSTGTGSARATSPTSSTGECASSGASRTSSSATA